MNTIIALLFKTLGQVYVTFTHNWPFLLVSVLIAVALKLYMNPEKVSTFLIRYRRVGVLGATAAAVGTPLCSCGTTAVILGMMASMMPWAPIVAFLVASPLTSPQELVYSAGLFGWPFALSFFIASILLGLLGGVLADLFERAGWLAGQARYQGDPPSIRSAPVSPVFPTITVNQIGSATQRFLPRHPLQRPAAVQVCCSTEGTAALQLPLSLPVQLAHQVEKPSRTAGCACSASQPSPEAAEEVTSAACACSGLLEQAAQEKPVVEKPKVTTQMFLKETWATGKNLLVMFFGFAFIGYLLNNLIPAAWVSVVFGPGSVYSVPLAATLGLPLYINTEASLPLVRALIDGGMSQGAALAFLITGAGTSFGAIAGTLTIARWRVTALVISILWIGGIASGFIYDLLLAAHLF